MAGVSVRTLHHYDAIGLLVPSSRTESGYRLYDDDALLRLQQILIGRELGLPLEEIRRSLDDPSFDRRRALLEQRAQLLSRAEQTTRMIRAIDHALDQLNRTEDTTMTTNPRDIFDGFDPAEHEAEAKARWGHTDAYAESTKRARSYSRADWERIRDEQNAIYADAARAMNAGRAPDDEAVMDIAERARLAIDRWFYPCSHAMHRTLADMYEQDERFAQSIDEAGAGLTAFLSAAIRANAARHATRPRT